MKNEEKRKTETGKKKEIKERIMEGRDEGQNKNKERII